MEPYAHVKSPILTICSQVDPCQSEVTTWTSKDFHLINAGINMGIIWSMSVGFAVIIRSSLVALHDYSEIIVNDCHRFLMVVNTKDAHNDEYTQVGKIADFSS